MDESTIVSCVEYADGRRERELDIEDVSDVMAADHAGHFVWIGVYEPNERLLRKLQEEFGLHDLAIEDALRAHQRPKVEEYGECLFVALRTAHVEEDGRICFGETQIFVSAHYVVSVRHGPSRGYTPVRQRCESVPHLLRLGPAFVLYALMDFIVDNYFPVVVELEERLSQLEDAIFGPSPDPNVTQRIYRMKTELLEFKRAVTPLLEACNRLMRFDIAFIGDETKRYLRDVYDHVVRVNESVDTVRELLASALDANLALAAAAQNEVSKRLAGWAAIIAVPTLIAGVYGMNFQFMPELHWSYGYPLIMGGMLAICGTIFWRLRRAGWI